MTARPKPSPAKRKPKRQGPAYWKKRADELFSRHIRARDERCQAAGTDHVTCGGVLQCAHIIPRRYETIRVHPDNAIALCAGHHVYYTHRPLEWEAWVELEFPGRWARLRKEALSGRKVNWQDEFESLKRLGGHD